MNLTLEKIKLMGCKYPKPVKSAGKIRTEKLALPKPGESKTCLDMRDLVMGKTNRKQREDLKPRKERKRQRCIVTGCYKQIDYGRHHILQKSILLVDHELNLIDLCPECHGKADEGIIGAADLFELKSQETGISVEEILKILSEHCGHLIYLDGNRVKVQKLIKESLIKKNPLNETNR